MLGVTSPSLGCLSYLPSERAFWKNFCDGIGRPELFTANPGAKYADHARGNVALRHELASIFATRTTAEWLDFGLKVNTPIAPVNTVHTIRDDPQFKDRLPFRPHQEAGTELMPSPIRLVGEQLPGPGRAPEDPGRDTDAVLAQVLGYDVTKIRRLRDLEAVR